MIFLSGFSISSWFTLVIKKSYSWTMFMSGYSMGMLAVFGMAEVDWRGSVMPCGVTYTPYISSAYWKPIYTLISAAPYSPWLVARYFCLWWSYPAHSTPQYNLKVRPSDERTTHSPSLKSERIDVPVASMQLVGKIRNRHTHQIHHHDREVGPCVHWSAIPWHCWPWIEANTARQ